MRKTLFFGMTMLLAAGVAAAQEDQALAEAHGAATEASAPATTAATKPKPASRAKSLGGGPDRKDVPAGLSLADTVRRAQRKSTKKPSLGVITNETLGKPEARSRTARKGTLIIAPASSEPEPDEAAPGTTEVHDNTGKSESDWRNRATAAQGQMKKLEEEVRRLESETKQLENDFYAWSDGNYRDGKIKPAWDQAKEDLKKAREQLDEAQAAQTNLEEDARKSGAPPGWLRDK